MRRAPAWQRGLAVAMLALVVAVAAGCSSSSGDAAATKGPTGVLLIAADDLLAAAFAAIKPVYEAATPGAQLALRFGPSAQLLDQIRIGAPTDLFFAGNTGDAQAIVTARLAGGPAVPFEVGPSGTSSVVILANSANVPGAAAFERWLAGPDGQAILKSYGFSTPTP